MQLPYCKIVFRYALVNILNAYEFNSEVVKDQFLLYVDEIQKRVLEGTASMSFEEYCWTLYRLTSNNFYFTLAQCLSYDETAQYVRANFERASWKSGYYDSKRDMYQDSEELVDPLGLGPGIGTYTITEEYRLHGDFMIESYSKYWYMTDRDDPHNTFREELYFRDDKIWISDDEISVFTNQASTGEIFYSMDAEESVNSVIVINQDSIAFTQSGNLLIVQYN